MSDAVIRAIADPSRRALLDALLRRDGQTVLELAGVVPQLGRHAVSKHLAVLESAALVSTHKIGRQRFCYLNPVPIVELAHRWIDDYSLAWGSALVRLRDHVERSPHAIPTLEGSSMTKPSATTAPPAHRHVVVIAAAPDAVWHAITDAEASASWYYGTGVRSDWSPGSSYAYTSPDGPVAIEGVVETIEPPRLLVMTFRALWNEAVAGDQPSRVTWSIEPEGQLSRVTVIHENITAGSATEAQTASGWPYLLSNLKTMLETGSPLPRSA